MAKVGGSDMACLAMVGGDDAEDAQVCSTSFGGGPVGELSLWAAALFCGGMMVFQQW